MSTPSTGAPSTKEHSTRIYPKTQPNPTQHPIPLFSTTSISAPNACALLLYDAAAAAPLERATMERSLAIVLDAYPQLTGRLRLARPNDTGRTYTKRPLRSWVEYGRRQSGTGGADNTGDDGVEGEGESQDPGFLLEIVHDPRTLSAVLPRPLDETANGQPSQSSPKGILDISHSLDMSLAPHLSPNLSATLTTTSQPIAGAKLTRFTDGAALVVAVSHMLFDAGALGTFLSDWAEVHRSLSSGDRFSDSGESQEQEPRVSLSPRPFDQAVLDNYALGSLDAPDEDPTIVAQELEISRFRYDSWCDPPPALRGPLGLEPSPDMEAADADHAHRRGPRPPWETLPASQPSLRQYAIEFTAGDVERIHAQVSAEAKSQAEAEAVSESAAGREQSGRSTSTNPPRISSHDALLAHLWQRISKSRGYTPSAELDLSVACDARGRIDPPVPPTAPGCFNVLLGQTMSFDTLSSPTGRAIAALQTRDAITGLTPNRVGAWLHRRAHDVSPQREWICFPGRNSVITTNWARAVDGVDFGAGGAGWVANLVVAMDGYLTILPMLARREGVEGRSEGSEEKARRKWYEPGVVVALWLEEESMDRLVADPLLRG